MTAPAARRPDAAAAAAFPGDSAMARRCRAFDWAATPLGPAAAWPAALRTAAALVLANGFPCILLWGPALVQLYNDGYVPFLGAKDAAALGAPTHACWPELRDFTAPIYARVLAGETVTLTEQPYALARGGPDVAPDPVTITLSFAPVRGDDGTVAGAFVTLFDVTAQVAARAAEAERARLTAALDVERARLAEVFRQSPSFLAVLRGPENVFEFVNDAYQQLVGRGRDVLGRPLFDALPEARGQGFDAYLARVRATGEPLVFRDLPVLVDRAPGAPREERFLDITYRPLVEADGTHDAVIAHGTDVTDQVRARRAVAASEAKERAARAEADAERVRLAGVLAAMGDAHIALDRDWRVVALNPAAERINGRPAADFLGRTHWEAWPASVGTDIERRYRRAMAERVPARFETHYAEPGVLDTWLAVDAVPTPDGGLGLFFRDVTARRRAEAEREAALAAERRARRAAEEASARLTASETFLRRVTDVAPDVLYVYDLAERRTVWGNRGVTAVLGYTAHEIAAMGSAVLPTLIHPDDWPAYERHAARLTHLRDGEVAELTYRMRRADGVWRWLESRDMAFRRDPADPAADGWPGAVREIVGAAADVTARHEAAAERERLLAAADLARRRLDAVLEALPVGVIVAEAPSGRLVYSNAAVGRIWGQQRSTARTDEYSAEWTGYHVDAEGRATARAYASHEWPLARAVAAGEVVAGEAVDVARPDGTRVRVSLSAAPIRDADGAVVGGVVVTADVSDAARARSALDAARRAAEEANAAKSQFLANMSHELRTPLNAIGGYVQLVEMGLHGPVTEAQRDALGRVQRSQRHLLGLINDVLNYAKLEAGKVEYRVEAVDLGEVLAEAAAMVEPQLRAKALASDVGRPAGPCLVWADPDKLRQVLLNLLSNAVKFTPAVQGAAAPEPGRPGRVAVRLTTDPDHRAADGPLLCAVEVTDTGVGIPADRLEAVFAPFVQVRAGVGRPAEGTGLGLAISRDLARGMGGDLTAESVVGAGSTFTLALRRVAAPQEDDDGSEPARRS